MNVYRCVSEVFGEVIPILDDGTGPMEYGCAAELVVAETRDKAKWAASCRTERGTLRPEDMLKWSVVLTRKNVDLPAGFITDTAKPSWWQTPKEICAAWHNRKANR